MNREIAVLAMTAASMGFLHTLFGPDHYLPFIMMARARRWNLAKTAWLTVLCGLGHVGSSVLIGFLGIGLGVSVNRLIHVEAFRGDIAAWLIIAFGLVYFIWGVFRAVKNKPHKHLHVHEDGTQHLHDHTHQQDHHHLHDEKGKASITPWVLFTIFVLGPCEPLIPMLMYPAAKNSSAGVIFVAGVFSLVTILTMLGIVIAISLGLNVIPLGKMERYTHAIAGFMICLSGVAIVFLGL